MQATHFWPLSRAVYVLASSSAQCKVQFGEMFVQPGWRQCHQVRRLKLYARFVSQHMMQEPFYTTSRLLVWKSLVGILMSISVQNLIWALSIMVFADCGSPATVHIKMNTRPSKQLMLALMQSQNITSPFHAIERKESQFALSQNSCYVSINSLPTY